MRIALVSTCAVATPPAAYGGTELVVAELARGLVQRGHRVTVFATGDSQVPGELRALYPRPQWPPRDICEVLHAEFAWKELSRGSYDLVHVHHAAALAFCDFVPSLPCVATVHHDRVPELVEHYRRRSRVSYVAISGRQAELSPEIRFARVIHHGLDPEAYPFAARAEPAVGFLGRLAPEKGPHHAIDAARAAGVPIELGGAAHEVARGFFDREMRHRLAAPGVRWLGELSHRPKIGALRRMGALLFPITWDEPFGLVMIEAMLVGTPVIAFGRGSVPEVVEEGVTGYVVRDVAEMARAIPRALALDRARIRARAVERFSTARMTAEHDALYAAITRHGSSPRQPHAPASA